MTSAEVVIIILHFTVPDQANYLWPFNTNNPVWLPTGIEKEIYHCSSFAHWDPGTFCCRVYYEHMCFACV